MPAHLDHDQLLALADGDPGVAAPGREPLQAHVRTCPACRERLAKTKAMTSLLPDLLSERFGCPSPEELAEVPVAGAWDHPHVVSCFRCRDEIAALSALDFRRLCGDLAAFGSPPRPRAFEVRERPGLFAGVAPVEIDIRAGATASCRVAGARVTLRVETGTETRGEATTLHVRVEESASAPLVVVLESDFFLRTEHLGKGPTDVALEARLFRKATVRVAEVE